MLEGAARRPLGTTAQTDERMDTPTVATFTAILRPPVTAAGRTRRWSAHCLDLDMGVSAESAEAVRLRLACSIAAEVAAARTGTLGPRRSTRLRARRASSDQRLWDAARHAPLVTCQTVETDAGPVEVRYVQPRERTDG